MLENKAASSTFPATGDLNTNSINKKYEAQTGFVFFYANREEAVYSFAHLCVLLENSTINNNLCLNKIRSRLKACLCSWQEN